jgi:hypothetical protein
MNPKYIFRFIRYFLLTAATLFLIINYIPFINDRVVSIFKYFQSGTLQGIVNISSLVYIKGFQMASHALLYYPIGVGFLNMGVLNEYSSVSQLNELLFTLNKDDGSSILFKILTEFGILGLLFFSGSLHRLIKLSRNNGDIYEQAFLFSFVAASVRGASYFDGPLIIGISIYVFYLKAKFTALLKAVIKDGTHQEKVIIYSH